MKQFTAGRTYQVSLSRSDHPVCPDCSALGQYAGSERRPDDIARSLKRAASGDYSTILFTGLDTKAWEEAAAPIAMAHAAGFSVTVWLCVATLAEPSAHLDVGRLLARGVGVGLLAHRCSPVAKAAALTLMRTDPSVDLILAPDHGDEIAGSLASLPRQAWGRIFLYPSFTEGQDKAFLSPPQWYAATRKLSRRFPGFVPRLPPGLEAWSPWVPVGLSLEPLASPLAKVTAEAFSHELSVVIPAFNASETLITTLRGLADQTLSALRFEVVIVDDGSDDETLARCETWAKSLPRRLNITLLSTSKCVVTRNGDRLNTAGVARNLGAKHATGEYLLFLDADILLPPDYLAWLIAELTPERVIMGQRVDLAVDVAGRALRAADVDPTRDVSRRQPTYFAAFHSKARIRGWQRLRLPWKYCFSHSLAVQAARFRSVGWFPKSMIFYGFEDIDLGYRLWRAKSTFHLAPKTVYHLPRTVLEAQSYCSEAERRGLLRRSALIFYMNCLDPAVYSEFRGMIKGASVSGLLRIPVHLLESAARIGDQARRFWSWVGLMPAPRAYAKELSD